MIRSTWKQDNQKKETEMKVGCTGAQDTRHVRRSDSTGCQDRRYYHVRAPYYQPLFLTSHSSCSCWERLLELDLPDDHLFVPPDFALGRPRRRRFAISFCNIYSQVNHRPAVHYPAPSVVIHSSTVHGPCTDIAGMYILYRYLQKQIRPYEIFPS